MNKSDLSENLLKNDWLHLYLLKTAKPKNFMEMKVEEKLGCKFCSHTSADSVSMDAGATLVTTCIINLLQEVA